MRSDVAISVKNLHKSFKLPHKKSNSLKDTIINSANYKKSKGYEVQEVLNGISFEINKGEFFGIVGRNGSGKSTLLKCLANIYTPEEGSIIINGSLTPFIELGVGFNPELSGKDNVYMNGALLGFSRKEIDSIYEEIVEFAELEKFMDQKLKNYSSGMQVRLAFSIAIRAKGDILLLDEVLAVGDEAFQRKCYRYFENLKEQKATVVLVTHNMSAVESFCDRALILESGKKAQIGESSQIAEFYYERNINEQEQANNNSSLFNDDKYRILESEIHDDHDEKANKLKPRKKYSILLRIDVKKDNPNLGIGMSFKSSGGVPIVGFNSYFDMDAEQKKKIGTKGKKTIRIEFENILKNGSYRVDVGLHEDRVGDSKDSVSSYHLAPLTIQNNALEFISSDWSPPGVKVDQEFKVRIEE